LKQIEVEQTAELAAAQAELEQKLKAGGNHRPPVAPDLFDAAKTAPARKTAPVKKKAKKAPAARTRKNGAKRSGGRR